MVMVINSVYTGPLPHYFLRWTSPLLSSPLLSRRRRIHGKGTRMATDVQASRAYSGTHAAHACARPRPSGGECCAPRTRRPGQASSAHATHATHAWSMLMRALGRARACGCAAQRRSALGGARRRSLLPTRRRSLHGATHCCGHGGAFFKKGLVPFTIAFLNDSLRHSLTRCFFSLAPTANRGYGLEVRAVETTRVAEEARVAGR